MIDPDGNVLASTSQEQPYVTVDIDLDLSRKSKSTFPHYVPEGKSGVQRHTARVALEFKTRVYATPTERLPREHVVRQRDDASCPRYDGALNDRGEDMAEQPDCVPGHWRLIRHRRLKKVRTAAIVLEELTHAYRQGKLRFFGDYAALADPAAFARWLAPLRACEWVVYAKRPFAGPEAVLAYLSRYTHRVAISNQRLIALDERGVTFRWKDYRASGRTRHKTMTLAPQEFMRRFLLHVLPEGFHRIRHYGLLANPVRRQSLATIRALLRAPATTAASDDASAHTTAPPFVCRHCGAPMVILDILLRSHPIRAPPGSRGKA
ncbi:hypothetical protein OKW30_008267 [Paraburkholderia sp. Clong3]